MCLKHQILISLEYSGSQNISILAAHASDAKWYEIVQYGMHAC